MCRLWNAGNKFSRRRRWCERINQRLHRTTRAPVAERLACERERMRALPCKLPDPDRRWVARVAPQPYLRSDRNDYSLDPRLAGRRVEITASQRAITAVALRAQGAPP